MMNPYLTIKEIKYDKDLSLLIILRGCLTLNKFNIDNSSSLEKEISFTSINPNSNNIKIKVLIKNPN